MTDEALDNFAMEVMVPPPPGSVTGMPTKASPEDTAALKGRVDRRRFFNLLRPAPSIALAAARFTESCVGGGRFDNNCAHFLGNAFILAGYSELLRSQTTPEVEARCFRLEPGSASPGCDPAARRPLRARELEKWFQSKAVRTKDISKVPGNTVQERYASIKNTGFWAVYQRDTRPGGYWGGHACIIDTDHWRYYGTGSNGYWYWELQHAYQW